MTVTSLKPILDATAGYRMMWINKKHPNVLYIDQRKEVNPDEVQDFRKLPYPDNSFALVVFDPPHDIRNGPSDPKSMFIKNFGWLAPETWQSDIRSGLSECYRVLRPEGTLIFKWGTHCKRIEQLYPLFPCEPLFGHLTRTAFRGKKTKTKEQTFWFAFMKEPASEN